MNQPYKQEIQIASYHCGSDALLRPDAFLHLCQEIAECHAHDEGFGYHWGIDRGVIWVMSQADIQINRRPRWKEAVILSTETGAASGLLARRWVRLESSSGELLMMAELQWLLIDTARRRPIPLRKADLELVELKAQLDDIPQLDWQAEPSKCIGYLTSWRDLDFHGHVNNASYLIWVLQHCSELIDNLKRVHIRFLKESTSGECLLINRTLTTSECNWVKYQVIDTEDMPRAELVMDWR